MKGPTDLLLVTAVAAALAAGATAQTPLQTELVAAGFEEASWAGSPRGDERVFVAEQVGLVQVVQPGGAVSVFLDIRPKVASVGTFDPGLHSLTFHPDYAQNGYLYVNYNAQPNKRLMLERYTVSGDPDVADPASAATILDTTLPTGFNALLGFGPDGYLRFSIGDDLAFGDCDAQALDRLRGKILRLDVDGGFPYAIPPDNPFVGVPGAREEILHVGLRNPWRWSIDPEAGYLYVGDVGDVGREEIDVVAADAKGLNFGWPEKEGLVCPTTADCPGIACGDPSLVDPVLEYDHGLFGECQAVIGGHVYRGCAIPDLRGTYFFADYCDGTFSSFEWDPVLGLQNLQDRTAELRPASYGFTASFGLDGDGEILIVDRGTGTGAGDGQVLRIAPAAPPAGLVDCDGDGFDDACEIAATPHLDLDGDGTLDLCQGLSASAGEISVSAGGTQAMSLHAGPAHAGKLYLVAGSITGTSPGTPVGSATLPLVVDVYTLLTVNDPGSTPLAGSLGVLDAAGEASAAFDLLPGTLPPSLVGLTVYHAYALSTAPVAGAVDFASNPIQVLLLP